MSASTLTQYVVWQTQDGFVLESAAEIVHKLESGQYNLTQTISLNIHSERRPIRRWIRELVYESQLQNLNHQEREDSERSRFETAFNDAPIGMALSDLSGRITHVNRALCEMLGKDRAQLTGLPVGSLSPAQNNRSQEIELANEMLSGRRLSYQMEKEFIHNDGSLIPVLVGVSILRNGHGQPTEVMAHITDLREQKKREREESFVRSMTTISKLAGSIAHDFNNVLTAILTNVELAKEFEDETEEFLEGIEAGAQAAARLVKQLSTLYTPSFIKAQPLQVDAVLRKMRPFFAGLLSNETRIVMELRAPTAVISIGQSQFEQILINIIINAAKSFTKDKAVLSMHTKILKGVNGDLIELQIKDNGTGMTPEVLQKAFEPFFTTREDEGGTGLGLSSVLTLVNKSRGTIDLASQVNIGTTVSLTWPIHDTALAQPTVMSLTSNDLQAKRIFVIDDQSHILQIISKTLAPFNCEVVTASSLQSAIQTLKEDSAFDIILSDVKLGDGTGPEVIKYARRNGYRGGVVYMSGFSGEDLSESHFNKTHSLFISKPFSSKSLRDLLAQSLSTPTR